MIKTSLSSETVERHLFERFLLLFVNYAYDGKFASDPMNKEYGLVISYMENVRNNLTEQRVVVFLL